VATYDHYTTPVPPGTWDVPAAGSTRFSWEYDDGRTRLLDLYQRGKDKSGTPPSGSTGTCPLIP
jgi:hypothetical protein